MYCTVLLFIYTELQTKTVHQGLPGVLFKETADLFGLRFPSFYPVVKVFMFPTWQTRIISGCHFSLVAAIKSDTRGNNSNSEMQVCSWQATYTIEMRAKQWYMPYVKDASINCTIFFVFFLFFSLWRLKLSCTSASHLYVSTVLHTDISSCVQGFSSHCLHSVMKSLSFPFENLLLKLSSASGIK